MVDYGKIRRLCRFEERLEHIYIKILICLLKKLN